MNLTLKIWRQKGPQDKGKMVDYKVSDISEIQVKNQLLLTMIVVKVFAECVPYI